MAYGPAIWQRVLAFYDEGLLTREIAQRLKLSESGCRRAKQRRHEPPRPHTGRKPKLDADARRQLALMVEQQPDATLEQLRARLLAELNITLSTGALWNTLRRMKLSLKKSR